MVFSSLFFVFFFLTLNLLLYNLVDGIEKKNMVMLVFSLIFYSWAGTEIFNPSSGNGIYILVYSDYD